MPKKDVLRKLLEDGFEWPRELGTGRGYQRLHDDHDGTEEHHHRFAVFRADRKPGYRLDDGGPAGH